MATLAPALVLLLCAAASTRGVDAGPPPPTEDPFVDGPVDDLGMRHPEMHFALPEQLDPRDVKAVVHGHRWEVEACEAKEKRAAPVKAVMRWVIQRDGSTRDVQSLSAELQGTVTAACLEAAIKAWRFPKFSGADMPIDYPFVLSR